MSNKYISDLHFNHTNIIKYSKRPFGSVEEMNAFMFKSIEDNFDKTQDTLYYLGDLSFGNIDKVRDIYNKIMDICGGQIQWIWGNHDKYLKIVSLEQHGQGYLEIKDGNKEVILCHYPIESWCNQNHKSIHLYGHTHVELPTDMNVNRFSVGCDTMGYVPLTINQIIERINIRNKGVTNYDRPGR